MKEGASEKSRSTKLLGFAATSGFRGERGDEFEVTGEDLLRLTSSVFLK